MTTEQIDSAINIIEQIEKLTRLEHFTYPGIRKPEYESGKRRFQLAIEQKRVELFKHLGNHLPKLPGQTSTDDSGLVSK